MQNTEIIERFEHYLKDEKNVSANTLSSYMRDIRQFFPDSLLDLHPDRIAQHNYLFHVRYPLLSRAAAARRTSRGLP